VDQTICPPAGEPRSPGFIGQPLRRPPSQQLTEMKPAQTGTTTRFPSICDPGKAFRPIARSDDGGVDVFTPNHATSRGTARPSESGTHEQTIAVLATNPARRQPPGASRACCIAERGLFQLDQQVCVPSMTIPSIADSSVGPHRRFTAAPGSSSEGLHETRATVICGFSPTTAR